MREQDATTRRAHARTRWRRALAPLVLVAAGPACATAPTAREAPPPRSTRPAPVVAPAPEPEPEPTSAVDDRPPPLPEDYYITQDDCRALSQTYQRVYRKSKDEEIGSDATPARQQLADRETAEATQSWLSACMAIVDTLQPRGNLACAIKARTLDRFEGCMAGQTD